MRACRGSLIFFAVMTVLGLASEAVAESPGDPDAGVDVFRACAACHSLEPGRHLTGPSLAGIWGRRAASATGFARYSEALKAARLTWDAETLDAWLADPQSVVPGNRMTFQGIGDERARRDLIAFLERAAQPGTQAPGPRPAQMPPLPDLKTVGPDRQVAAIRYCGDSYYVTTAAGETVSFWEFNLRFKTDSSDQGPPAGQPVLLPASMMGDRAFVVFAAPEEISAAIRTDCKDSLGNEP